MFDENMIFRIPALLIALTVHEYAHARVAVALGDPTPRFEGRLTLNPIAHLDPFGLIMLWLVQFGWAKPVSVNARNFKNWRQGMMLVSLAGPGINLITGFVSMIVLVVMIKMGIREAWLITTLNYICSYNVMFAVFNMLPIPPLDGSKVLMNYLPGRLAYQYESYSQYGTLILMGLIMLNVVSFIIGPIIGFILDMMRIIVTLIF
uniref:site-2 protease family protein n=1 Tax=Massilibacillus massiliensis TaxID=1806837 RepID=UPI000ABA8A7F|nr:site-2 protease family protein [Massilibacillus massiliensis]